MAAIPLFDKQPARTRASGKTTTVTDAQQLNEWLRRGQSEVFTIVHVVTPDLARLILAHNDANRPVAWNGFPRSVAAYAGAMKRGEWSLNGEAIIIANTGELNDGQHRLHGVIQAQCGVPMQLTFGVERDSRHTVDQGMGRTPGNVLAIQGEINTNALACELQFLWATDEGRSLNERPSIAQLLATLERHPESREAVTAVSKLAAHYRLSFGYIAGAYYRTRERDAFYADQYLGALTTGLNIASTSSPVARLRRQFEDHRAQLKGSKIDRATQAALYIKGFNNILKGRTGPVVWRATGPAPEAFPTVGG